MASSLHASKQACILACKLACLHGPTQPEAPFRERRPPLEAEPAPPLRSPWPEAGHRRPRETALRHERRPHHPGRCLACMPASMQECKQACLCPPLAGTGKPHGLRPSSVTGSAAILFADAPGRTVKGGLQPDCVLACKNASMQASMLILEVWSACLGHCSTRAEDAALSSGSADLGFDHLHASKNACMQALTPTATGGSLEGPPLGTAATGSRIDRELENDGTSRKASRRR